MNSKDKMANQILDELTHIDEGARHTPQALLRMLYSAQRRKQLEKNPQSDPGTSLRKALARTQREYPYFIASFDTSFFRLHRGRLSAGRGASDAFRLERDPGFRPHDRRPRPQTGRLGATS
jgi:hypothetical protein